jgi:pyrroline-5-carboxylate reductase
MSIFHTSPYISPVDASMTSNEWEARMARTTQRIGIIGGGGWLGGAFAQAMLDTHFIEARHLTLSSRAGSGAIAGASWTRDNQALVDSSDVVVLSVRPEQFGDVVIEAQGKLVISVMAGVSLATLARHTGAVRLVRAMPNAAATIGECYTPWFATAAVTAADKALVQGLFETCGQADEVRSEADIDYFCGLTGSGAGFPALLASAMIAHAEGRGLPAELARRAVLSVVTGASRLLADTDPAQMMQALIDYRGTTAAALQTMIDEGFERAVHAGLDAADARAGQMARASADRLGT